MTNFDELHLGVQKQLNIQGHRGARGHFPENTLAGFIKAVEFGADTLELDVIISADGQVVVSHEAWMNETICSFPDGTPVGPGKGKEYNLYRMQYHKIKEFDCGRRGHPEFPLQATIPSFKPLLSEVIASVENHVKKNNSTPVAFNIELKTEEAGNMFNPEPSIFVELVLHEINQYHLGDRFSFSSFDLTVLRELRKQESTSKIGLLVENNDSLEVNIDRLGFIPDTYNPDFTLVNEHLIKDGHGVGIKIIPWTVNEKKDMELLITLGVDGIITDYPDKLADLIKNNTVQK